MVTTDNNRVFHIKNTGFHITVGKEYPVIPPSSSPQIQGQLGKSLDEYLRVIVSCPATSLEKTQQISDNYGVEIFKDQ